MINSMTRPVFSKPGFKLSTVAFALLANVAFAQGVYKCSVKGQMVYQDMPCRVPSETVRKVGIDKPPAPDAAGKSEKNSQESARIANKLKRVDLERRIAAIEQKKVFLQLQHDQDAAEIERKQGLARNNLAGATYLQSLSAEKQAIATRYQADLQSASAEIATLRDQLKTLGGNGP